MKSMSGISEDKVNFSSDPPDVTIPYTFSILVDEHKCIGCVLCIDQCSSLLLNRVERETSSNQIPPCQDVCPVSVDINRYMNMLSNGGSFEDAWKVITDSNPMPAITGRVCACNCETHCNRAYLDAPVNINRLERFIGDYGIYNNLTFEKGRKSYKDRVAVIGAGPSGMSCAYHLERRGYRVTVFETRDKPGGMLRYAIPRYRLPDDIVDKEIQRILDLGVEVKYDTIIGKDITIGDLIADYKAVYVAVGAQKGKGLRIKGENSADVYVGLDFLRQIAERKPVVLGKKVVIIGGGNVAVDVARSVLRTGVQAVTMVCLEQRHEMPAWDSEIKEALQEDIEIINGYGPKEILLNKENRVTAVIFKKCVSVFDERGYFLPEYNDKDELCLETDCVMVAIGQIPDCSFLKGVEEIKIPADGAIVTDNQTKAIGKKGVFAGGDIASGPKTVSEAIGMGKAGALAIDAYLRGKNLPRNNVLGISYKDIPLEGYEKILRSEAPSLPVEQRLSNPDVEVNLPLNREQVLNEVKRCFVCGKYKPEYTGEKYSKMFSIACHNCHNCEVICPTGAINFDYD